MNVNITLKQRDSFREDDDYHPVASILITCDKFTEHIDHADSGNGTAMDENVIDGLSEILYVDHKTGEVDKYDLARTRFYLIADKPEVKRVALLDEDERSGQVFFVVPDDDASIFDITVS